MRNIKVVVMFFFSMNTIANVPCYPFFKSYWFVGLFLINL